MSSDAERHLKSIGDWAKGLPESAWKPGVPPFHKGAYYAVKTISGRILTGGAQAFRPAACRQFSRMPKYGPIVAYVEAGD